MFMCMSFYHSIFTVHDSTLSVESEKAGRQVKQTGVRNAMGVVARHSTG